MYALNAMRTASGSMFVFRGVRNRSFARSVHGRIHSVPENKYDPLMPILQEQHLDPAAASQIAASSLERPQDLEYPHAAIPARTGNSVMPLILWSMALLFGILICLVRLPLSAPPIDQLTLYTCDPLPPLPSLGSRQSYPLNLRCRAGDQVIYQRTNTIPYSYQVTTIPCRKQTGPTQIWHMAPPSPYGSYIFRVACGDLVITDYKTRAATYETTQRFVIAIDCVIILASAIGLMRLARPRLHRTSSV
jgi:hypothetical protein